MTRLDLSMFLRERSRMKKLAAFITGFIFTSKKCKEMSTTKDISNPGVEVVQKPMMMIIF